MRMIFLYCRQSTDEQTSLEAQEETLRRHAQAYPNHIPQPVHETKSGSNLISRPRFLAMVADAKRGDVIAVWDSSRLGRNAMDIQAVRVELRKKGVLLLEGGKVYEDTPTDKFQSQLIDAVSEFQRSIQLEKTNLGIESRYSTGRWRVGQVFGYRALGKGKDGKIVQHPEEAEVVRSIFRQYREGKTLNALCDWLNLQQVATRRGGRWTPTTVRRLLLRPLYAGVMLPTRGGAGKGTFERVQAWTRVGLITAEHYEPIVSLDEFEVTLKLVLGREGKHQIRVSRRKGKFLLTGMLECGYCGPNMAKLLPGLALSTPLKRDPASFRHTPVIVGRKRTDYWSLSPNHDNANPYPHTTRSLVPEWWLHRVTVAVIRKFGELRVSGGKLTPFLEAYQQAKRDELDGMTRDVRAVLGGLDAKVSDLDEQITTGVNNLLRQKGAIADLLTEELAKLEKSRGELVAERTKLSALLASQGTDDAEAWLRANLNVFDHDEIPAQRQVLRDLLVCIGVQKSMLIFVFRCNLFCYVDIPGAIRTQRQVDLRWDGRQEISGGRYFQHSMPGVSI